MNKNLIILASLMFLAACATDPNVKTGGVWLARGNLIKASQITEDQITKCWVRDHSLISYGITYSRQELPAQTVFEVRRTSAYAKDIDPFLTIRIVDKENEILSIDVSEKEYKVGRVLNLSEDVKKWIHGQRDCYNSTK